MSRISAFRFTVGSGPLLFLIGVCLLPCACTHEESGALPGSKEGAAGPVTGKFAFLGEKLNRLRDNAIRAVGSKGEPPIGWSISPADPMTLVAAFEGLKVKKGFVLRAYDYHDFAERRAVVWAMPERSELPPPDQCPKVKLQHIRGEVPKPSAALDDFTDLIEGDGSPWSYLCASVMIRELKEMRPFWHALDWRTHVILGQNPWEPGSPKVESVGHAINPRREWRWDETEPRSWQPTVRVEKDKITVTFYTFSAYRGQICRHVDTFKPGSYRFQTQVEAIASCGGFKF